MKWPGWSNIPAVKPVAVAGAVFAVGIVLIYVARSADIPPNITDMVKTLFLACFGIYGGKSVIEHGINLWADDKRKPWEKSGDGEQ